MCVTIKQINIHFTTLRLSTKGHFPQERQGVQSTELLNISSNSEVFPKIASNGTFPILSL